MTDQGACLFLVSNLGMGGSEQKTIRVINRLVSLGIKVHLAYLNGPEDLLLQINDQVSVIDLGRTGKFDWRVIRRLRQYINQQNIRLVWNVNLYPMIYSRIAIQDIKRRVKLYVSVNTTYFQYVSERVAMLLYIPLLHCMDKVIFGSVFQQKLWKRNFLLKRKRIITIHNGVDLEYFNPARFICNREETRSSLGISKEEVVIGMVAQFRPEKGHMDLVCAFKELAERGRSVKLLLVGDGPKRKEIENAINSFGLGDRVIFSGLVQDVRPQLMAMDIFVLTSTAVETFSNAALEAMAMRKPVILSNLSGASEMVENGINGYLFEPGDVNGLLARIEILLDLSTRESCLRKAYERVHKDFSFDRMVAEYEHVIGACG